MLRQVVLRGVQENPIIIRYFSVDKNIMLEDRCLLDLCRETNDGIPLQAKYKVPIEAPAIQFTLDLFLCRLCWHFNVGWVWRLVEAPDQLERSACRSFILIMFCDLIV